MGAYVAYSDNSCFVFQVKINQRLPGRGMSMQIMINSEGKENVSKLPCATSVDSYIVQ